MKRFFIVMVKIILCISLCLGVLVSCDNNDDDKNLTITNADPSYGFMANSTEYHLLIDFGEKEKFELRLPPRQVIEMNLQYNRTYVMHVVVLNNWGGVISEYINAFFIDNIPLDNQFREVVCSWYFEFISNYPEYGFANKSGT